MKMSKVTLRKWTLSVCFVMGAHGDVIEEWCVSIQRTSHHEYLLFRRKMSEVKMHTALN